MSYINDALRKAQKDKDNRYESFGGVIAPSPEGPNRPRKRRVIVGTTVALVILVSAVLLFAVYGLQRPSAQPKGAPPATVAEKPAPKAMERAIRPPDGPPVTREADVRYQEALIAQRMGDLRRAEALYEKVLALDPGHVRTLNNLGVIYMGQKKWGKAIAVFGRAVVLKKDYVDPYYNLACLYAQTNEIDESLWYLKVAVAIDGGVINWVKKDADMKNVVASPEFKKIMEGQKN
ncbi:MAG: tetratricopeptide repeat protein [Deltaproteobacteria bacterium]|nr:tetratricopeptide repeat protein [Deltaproteobacteria bacterium]